MRHGRNNGCRKLVVALYIVVFWVLLPIALFVPSRILDSRGLRLGRSRVRGVIAVPLFLGAAYMLLKSVLDFSRGTSKLPITALPPYDKLVRTGVYAAWRHPVYLFYTVMVSAVALFVSSGGFFAVVLPAFVSLELVHAGIEERWLLRRHGKKYAAYRRDAALVFPPLRSLKKVFLS